MKAASEILGSGVRPIDTVTSALDDVVYRYESELLAMAQDCEKLFGRDDIDMDINFHGENTLVASLWKTSPIQKLKHYTEVIGG